MSRENCSNSAVSLLFYGNRMHRLSQTEMKSSIFMNDGNGNFTISHLPTAAQMSPMYAILPYDFDKDGDLDLFMGGNLYGVQPEMGRYDASYGHILENDEWKLENVAIISRNALYDWCGIDHLKLLLDERTRYCH